MELVCNPVLGDLDAISILKDKAAHKYRYVGICIVKPCGRIPPSDLPIAFTEEPPTPLRVHSTAKDIPTSTSWNFMNFSVIGPQTKI